MTGPLVLAAILYRACAQGACTLVSSNANFTTKQLNITVKGQPAMHNPDVESTADFSWTVNNGIGGTFMQANDETNFNFRIGSWTLRGAAGHHVPWNKDKCGPEGLLGNLPLPLHWFVYSLRSQLTFFELQNVDTGKTVRGNRENVFSKQWIWSEAYMYVWHGAKWANTKVVAYNCTSSLIDNNI